MDAAQPTGGTLGLWQGSRKNRPLNFRAPGASACHALTYSANIHAQSTASADLGRYVFGITELEMSWVAFLRCQRGS